MSDAAAERQPYAPCLGCGVRARQSFCSHCWYRAPSALRERCKASGDSAEMVAYFAKPHRIYECGRCYACVVGNRQHLPLGWTANSHTGYLFCNGCRYHKKRALPEYRPAVVGTAPAGSHSTTFTTQLKTK